MRRPLMFVGTSTLVILVACKDSGTGPSAAAPCPDDTGTVTVSVSSGSSGPVFDWTPACAVALLLIEEGGADRWGISTDDATWSDPAVANLIEPPIAYGDVPSGVDEFEPPASLAAGTTYDVVIWRVPPGSTATCLNVAFGACMMADHDFVP